MRRMKIEKFVKKIRKYKKAFEILREEVACIDKVVENHSEALPGLHNELDRIEKAYRRDINGEVERLENKIEGLKADLEKVKTSVSCSFYQHKVRFNELEKDFEFHQRKWH